MKIRVEASDITDNRLTRIIVCRATPDITRQVETLEKLGFLFDYSGRQLWKDSTGAIVCYVIGYGSLVLRRQYLEVI